MSNNWVFTIQCPICHKSLCSCPQNKLSSGSSNSGSVTWGGNYSVSASSSANYGGISGGPLGGWSPMVNWTCPSCGNYYSSCTCAWKQPNIYTHPTCPRCNSSPCLCAYSAGCSNCGCNPCICYKWNTITTTHTNFTFFDDFKSLLAKILDIHTSERLVKDDVQVSYTDDKEFGFSASIPLLKLPVLFKNYFLVLGKDGTDWQILSPILLKLESKLIEDNKEIEKKHVVTISKIDKIELYDDGVYLNKITMREILDNFKIVQLVAHDKAYRNRIK